MGEVEGEGSTASVFGLVFLSTLILGTVFLVDEFMNEECNVSTGSVYSVWILMFGTVPVGNRVKIRRVTLIYPMSHQEV